MLCKHQFNGKGGISRGSNSKTALLTMLALRQTAFKKSCHRSFQTEPALATHKSKITMKLRSYFLLGILRVFHVVLSSGRPNVCIRTCGGWNCAPIKHEVVGSSQTRVAGLRPAGHRNRLCCSASLLRTDRDLRSDQFGCLGFGFWRHGCADG